MALQGKFVINNADYSPLTIYGIGTFMAFSGNGAYRNQVGYEMIPDEGPIPPGRYWVVDRPGGNVWSQFKTGIKDVYNHMVYDAQFNHNEWFALYRNDGKIDDYTWITGVARGNFRLHPGRVSKGCITLVHDSDYALIRHMLLRTMKQQVPGKENLMAYGTIEVS